MRPHGRNVLMGGDPETASGPEDQCFRNADGKYANFQRMSSHMTDLTPCFQTLAQRLIFTGAGLSTICKGHFRRPFCPPPQIRAWTDRASFGMTPPLALVTVP